MERSAIQESPASAGNISGHSDPGFRFAASGLRLLHRFVGPQLLGLELCKAASKHDLRGDALLLSIFLLHLVVNDCGELLASKITAGNVDDRNPVLELARALSGKLFGDRGYISQKLFEQLWERRVQLITKLRKDMKNKLLPLFDKLLLRKRSLVETINDQLKNISQIEHSRHRSPFDFFVNLVAGLVAYTFREKKPSLNI